MIKELKGWEKLKYLIPGYGYYLAFFETYILDLSDLTAIWVMLWQITVVWTPITLLVCHLAGN